MQPLLYLIAIVLGCSGGFVDMFTGQIHSDSAFQIQNVIYQIDNKDLLDISCRLINCYL